MENDIFRRLGLSVISEEEEMVEYFPRNPCMTYFRWKMTSKHVKSALLSLYVRGEPLAIYEAPSQWEKDKNRWRINKLKNI